MGVRDAELDENERRCKRRVDVAGHEREVWWVGSHDRLEPLHGASRLLGVRARSDVESVRRWREPELVYEQLRELRVVVLTSVDYDVLGIWEPSLQLCDDRSHLHEIRPRPHDVEKSSPGSVGSRGLHEHPIVSKNPLIYSWLLKGRFWVQRSVEDPSDVSVVGEPGGNPLPDSVSTSRNEPRQAREEPPHENVKPMKEPLAPTPEQEELLAKVRRLEVQLERYREHAQRTSKLFQSVTHYVEWVRESARRDAELALRKARARVDKLNKTANELERTEDELTRVRDELAHLQALTDVTRERLSTFLTAGLETLNSDVAVAKDDSPNLALADLQDTLQERLTSKSVPAPARPAKPEGPAL